MKWFKPEAGRNSADEGRLMKKTRVDSNDRSATLVAPDTSVQGDIQFSGRLYVSGTVTGNVAAKDEASATLFVDEGGSVEGDIRAANVIIAGRVEGNVFAGDRLEVTATGRIRGEMSYKQIGVELGGLVNGKVLCVEEDGNRGNLRVFELPGDSDRDT